MFIPLSSCQLPILLSSLQHAALKTHKTVSLSSAWTQRPQLISMFYNQLSVLNHCGTQTVPNMAQITYNSYNLPSWENSNAWCLLTIWIPGSKLWPCDSEVYMSRYYPTTAGVQYPSQGICPSSGVDCNHLTQQPVSPLHCDYFCLAVTKMFKVRASKMAQ